MPGISLSLSGICRDHDGIRFPVVYHSAGQATETEADTVAGPYGKWRLMGAHFILAGVIAGYHITTEKGQRRTQHRYQRKRSGPRFRL